MELKKFVSNEPTMKDTLSRYQDYTYSLAKSLFPPDLTEAKKEMGFRDDEDIGAMELFMPCEPTKNPFKKHFE